MPRRAAGRTDTYMRHLRHCIHSLTLKPSRRLGFGRKYLGSRAGMSGANRAVLHGMPLTDIPYDLQYASSHEGDRHAHQPPLDRPELLRPGRQPPHRQPDLPDAAHRYGERPGQLPSRVQHRGREYSGQRRATTTTSSRSAGRWTAITRSAPAQTPAGWVGYFPESAYYGPQSISPDLTMLVLQFGGPSGQGFASVAQRRKGSTSSPREAASWRTASTAGSTRTAFTTTRTPSRRSGSR